MQVISLSVLLFTAGRRVGKTALINEFCKDKPTIFFSALNTTGKENLEALSKSIMSFERPDMEVCTGVSDLMMLLWMN